MKKIVFMMAVMAGVIVSPVGANCDGANNVGMPACAQVPACTMATCVTPKPVKTCATTTCTTTTCNTQPVAAEAL